MALINQPLTSSVDDISIDENQNAVAVVNSEWRNFFGAVSNICIAVTSSGTTVQRPTKFLFTGRPYFDTTLGIPIWYKTAGWVNSVGGAV